MLKVKRVKKLVNDLGLMGLSIALAFFGAISTYAQGLNKTKQPTLKQFQSALAAKSRNKSINSGTKNLTPVRLQDQTNPNVAAASVFSPTQAVIFSPKKEDGFPISGKVELSYEQSMIDHADGSRQASQSVSARIGWAMSENYSLNGSFSVDQDLRNGETKRGNGMSDIGIILARKPWETANWLETSLALSTVIPASEQSTRVIGLESSIGVNYTLSLTPAILAKGFETSLTLGASRNFHKYETSAEGTVLNPYAIKEILNTGYTYNKTLSFSFEFIHRHAWSYGGNVSESFEHSEELGYVVTPKWSVAVGHTNSGSWLKANAQDSNLKLINEDESIVYLSTSVMF